MPSNLKLLLFGLLVGAFSSLYPRIPAYLPHSLLPFIPFLTRPTLSPESNAWTGYQRYQSQHPVAKNHDPLDVNEPIEERKRRLESKDGQKQREKMEQKERKALEGRTETAGHENRIHDSYPVYFVDERQDATWSMLTRELAQQVKPKMVLYINSITSPSDTVSITSSPLSQPVILSLAYEGIIARASDTATTSSKRFKSFEKALAGKNIPVLEIGVPDDWAADKLLKVGHGLHRLRDQEMSLVGVGKWIKGGVPREELHDALVAHTSKPRELALCKVSTAPPALTVITGSADEGEGESLDGGKGLSWRLGHVPLRKS
ncbi:hypothetical protein P7C70_g6548, partial [Phenoliferia sp. Uapishka_3]